jgi:hypothetical protein
LGVKVLLVDSSIVARSTVVSLACCVGIPSLPSWTTYP